MKIYKILKCTKYIIYIKVPKLPNLHKLQKLNYGNYTYYKIKVCFLLLFFFLEMFENIRKRIPKHRTYFGRSGIFL